MEQKNTDSSKITGEMLFGRLTGMTKKADAQNAEIPQNLAEQLNALSRRLKMLEDRYNNIRKQAIVTDQNMIEDSKNIQNQITMLLDDINDIRKKVKDVFEKLTIFQSELSHTAKKSDVNVLVKYMMMWEPMNFMTRKEAEAMIKEALENKK